MAVPPLSTDQSPPGKLLPILREGIEIVKMLLFQRLREQYVSRHPEKGERFASRLSGAVVGQLFGCPSPDEPFASFAREQAALIDQELAGLATSLAELRIPLTDALRLQALCDHQQGRTEKASTAVLRRARQLDLLIEERELPMPHRFLEMVRRLGSSQGLLRPSGTLTKS